MAKLILTDEEKAAATWPELDDATLGKLVKKQALAIMDKSTEMERVTSLSAGLLLCGYAVDANAAVAQFEINGFTAQGQAFGDWRITVARVDAERMASQSDPDAGSARTTGE